MARKHNTKHHRSKSSYGAKRETRGTVRMSDPQLSDGRRAAAKRG